MGANSTGKIVGKAAQPKRSLFGPKVKRAELVDVTSQLAIMSRAGVDIASALESLVRQCKSPLLRSILEEVHESVLGGKSVSESISNYGHVFDETYVAAVAAGEATGRLPEVLAQLAALLRNDMRLRNSVRTMLAYPILLSSVSGIVLLALILFVLPKFADIFADFEAPLPMITQFLLIVSSELRTRLWLWGPLILSCLTTAYLYKRSAAGCLMWDRVMLFAPVISKVTRALLIGRVCRLLGIMIDSGVPLLDSLRLARASVKNSLYKALFVELEDDVMNGRGLSKALLASAFIPGSAGEMVVTAEKTGTLGMVTQMIGQHYEEEGEAKLKEFVAFLEPVITVVMGFLVAVIVMSVMLPLFDLSSAAKG
ncbi:MAG TPA: type II secretion system F family protein [Pirellulaceae bacterium]|nr:type II secretion system F family protein [Pirellulaceae bacterium]